MVARATRARKGPEKRKASVAVEDCRTDSAGIGRPCTLESEGPFTVHNRTRTPSALLGRVYFCSSVCYTLTVTSVTLGYSLKLYPSRNKADRV
jgi:hypothetical protein